MRGRPNRGRLKSKPADAPRAGLAPKTRGAVAARLRYARRTFSRRPVSGSVAGTQLGHTKRRHRVKGRDPASGRPDTEGLRRRRHTGPTPTAATANPAALPPQHGETLRLLVTAVELDRTGAKAGPHSRLLDVKS